MIFSQELLLSDNQAITVDALSTNVIDLGAQGVPYGDAAALAMDKGLVNPIPFLVQVTQDFNNLTNLNVAVVTDSDSALGSPTTLFDQTILLADLVAGKKLNFDILPNGLTERYLGLSYDVTGTAPTTGTIMAGVVAAVQNN
ncbi:MAG: Bbp16 family capsid cement protein [Pseudomonadota bacterium]